MDISDSPERQLTASFPIDPDQVRLHNTHTRQAIGFAPYLNTLCCLQPPYSSSSIFLRILQSTMKHTNLKASKSTTIAQTQHYSQHPTVSAQPSTEGCIGAQSPWYIRKPMEIQSANPSVPMLFTPLSLHTNSKTHNASSNIHSDTSTIKQVLYCFIAIMWLLGIVIEAVPFILAWMLGVDWCPNTTLKSVGHSVGLQSLGRIIELLRNGLNGWAGWLVAAGVVGYEVLREVGRWQVGTWMVC